MSITSCMRQCRNVSTTPLRQSGFGQCLPFSWTTLRGKHCWRPIAAVMGVVDTFEHTLVLSYLNFNLGRKDNARQIQKKSLLNM